MCGSGGSQAYGDLAGGIAGMFASSPQGGMAAGSVPAPAMQGDTLSGIGGFMPAQTAGYTPQTAALGSGSYMTPQTPMFAAEAMYSPEAAAQARLASMPQTQAMSVADLTPNATAAATAPPPNPFLQLATSRIGPNSYKNPDYRERMTGDGGR